MDSLTTIISKQRKHLGMAAERRHHQIFISVFLVMRTEWQCTHLLVEYAAHDSQQANWLAYMQCQITECMIAVMNIQKV